MEPEDNIRLETQGGVGLLTIARPEKLNALTGEMMQALKAACARIERDDRLRVVILTGDGKAFSAGGGYRCLEFRIPG